MQHAAFSVASRQMPLLFISLLFLRITSVSLLPVQLAAAAASNEIESASISFTAHLLQLTEAVLAPAWSTGGYAYALDGHYLNNTNSTDGSSASPLRAVCLRTRSSLSLVTAPFTFAMFDTQFSPLYGVAADNATATAVGQLNLQRNCYVSTASAADCTAVFLSLDGQCAARSEDALHRDWAADTLSQGTEVARSLVETTSLPASGLTAAELFAVFVNDYLPQRAWLRTAVPRSLDLLATAAQALRAFQTRTSALSDASDEVADMQDAMTEQWNRYLWKVYGPQLRRKWSLFYQYAVASLTRGGLAAAVNMTAFANVSEDSITGVQDPATTSCPLVDAWMQLRYQPDNLTLARLTPYMSAALTKLSDALAAIRQRVESRDGAAGQTDTLLFDLVRSAYCVTTTNLFAVTALLDRTFLRATTSVWVEAANHPDSWAWQTMQGADSAAEALGNASAFQNATVSQVQALAASLSTSAEVTLITCLARFLDVTTPLTSGVAVSPSDCVQTFLKTRDSSVAVAAELTNLFDITGLAPVSVAGSVPGLTRYESVVALPSINTSVSASLLQWYLVQESARSLTGQAPVIIPAVTATAAVDACTGASSSAGPVSNEGDVYECASGAYVLEASATCATCPSACAATAAATTAAVFSFTDATAAFPVYCPGDGLMHGCPYRPPDAVYAGSTTGGQTGPAAICRYTCINPYTAPLNYSCLSVRGTFYNASATGNADRANGGGLSSCVGPVAMFPATAPVYSQTPLYAFVGSGVANQALSCPFTLLHRATSSAVSRDALSAIGAVPPFPFSSLSESSSGSTSSVTYASSALTARNAVTWEVAVELNATQLHVMHTDLLQSLRAEAGEAAEGDTTTIAHELMSLHGVAAAEDTAEEKKAARVASWYLLTTVSHSSESDTDSAATRIRLQLLLNLSLASPVPVTPTAAPVPSSLVVLSSAWMWLPGADAGSAASAAASLTTATYRAVFNLQTSSVAFSVNDNTELQSFPAVVDWPLWSAAKATAKAAITSSAEPNLFLSVGGWVASYSGAQQWVLHLNPPSAAPGDSTVNTPNLILLPLYFNYLPGMVTRVATAGSLVSALHKTLSVAETAWRAEVAARSTTLSQEVTQLTSLADLALYVAPTLGVTANVSAALAKMALQTTKGLDGVCRPGYGLLPTSSSTAVCELCMTGGYTTMDAAAGSNWCTCTPQRVLTTTKDALTNAESTVCLTRAAGPAVPLASLTTRSTLYVDGDVVNADNASVASIPLGWYAAATTTAAASGESAVQLSDSQGSLSEATSLTTSVVCAFGLTSATAAQSTTDSTVEGTYLNSSIALRYTSGLGGETCVARAAARGGLPIRSGSATAAEDAVDTWRTKPAYTQPQSYSVRLQAPAWTSAAITLANHSAFFSDQTVLAVGIRNYAFLPYYAVHSLLHVGQLTEYHLSFLAYVLRSVTVKATLHCGEGKTVSGDSWDEPRGAARVMTWANASALDTAVLWLNLTEVIKDSCALTFRVISAATAAPDGAVPFRDWPYSYLRPPSSLSPSAFFANSATLTYVIEAPTRAFTTTEKHHVLGELSSFLMAACIFLLSLVLGFFRAISDHAPTFDVRPWKRYERELRCSLSDGEDA